MHDVLLLDKPPHRKPIMLEKPSDRVGTTYIPTDKSKIIAIIESNKPDSGRALRGSDETSETIAGYIMDFFTHEIKAGRLPQNLLPLQSGVGSIANAVVGGLVKSQFTGLTLFSEVFQDTVLDFLDSGKCDSVSCASLSLSAEGFERWWKNYDKYKSKVIIRPQQISNHPELVRRLGVISMNTPVEFDIYAHVNSSLVAGTRMINGIGGSNDFARNAYISMMHTPSARPSKTDPLGISCIVPKVSHVDHTEHDMSVFVTEQGLADLRGLSPKERALVIINKCAHPAFKDYLKEYFDRACTKTGMHHEPHILKEAYDMYVSLEEAGTMRFWEKK
jgi:acetyl-CoA hydrolase